MNDELVGIGGLHSFPWPLRSNNLSKNQTAAIHTLKSIWLRAIRKTPNTNVVNLTHRRHLREVLQYSVKGLKRPDSSTRHTDPNFWKKYKNGGTTIIK